MLMRTSAQAEASGGGAAATPISKNVKVSGCVGFVGYCVALALLLAGWDDDISAATMLFFLFGCLGLGLASLIITLTCFVLAGEGRKASAGFCMLVLFVADLSIAIAMLSGAQGAPIMGIIFGVYGVMGSIAVAAVGCAMMCFCSSKRPAARASASGASDDVLLRPWLLANGFGEFADDVGDLTKQDILGVTKQEFVATYRGASKDAASRALRLASLYNRLASTDPELGVAAGVVVATTVHTADGDSHPPAGGTDGVPTAVPVVYANGKGAQL